MREVSSSVFVTLGCRQLKGSCHFARLQSESVFVSNCHRPRLSPSSTVSVFVCLGLRMSPSWCKVVGPEGVGCLSDVLHQGSGNHRGVRVTVCTVFRKV